MVSFAQNELVIACSTPVMYLNQKGTLYFTSRRLAFSDEKTNEFTVSVGHASIAKQLVNPDTAKVLMMIVVCQDNSPKGKTDYKFSFLSDNAASDRKAIKEAISQMKLKLDSKPSQVPEVASAPHKKLGEPGGKPETSVATDRLIVPKNRLSDLDVRIRCTILKKSPQLAALHQELVVNGVVSEEEFWENRQYLLRNQAAELTQKKAQSTAWIDIKPSAQEGNEIKYTLTPEIIHDIFLQHPSVQQAYDENVPDKVSEESFWKRFFGSKYFHRNRSVGRGNVDTEDALFDPLLTIDDLAAETLVKKYDPATFNKTLDLSASEQDHGETGNAADFTMQPGKQRDAMALIRRFNLHSEQVVRNAKQTNSGYNQTIDYTNDIIYTDLEKPKPEFHIPLDVQNRTTLFNSTTDEANQPRLCNAKSKQLNETFFKNYRDSNQWHTQKLTNYNNGAKHTMKRIHNSFSVYHRHAKTKRTLSNNLPESTLEKIIGIQQAINELLRHFWACSLTNESNPDRIKSITAKKERMIVSLKPIQERLNKLLSELNRTNEEEFKLALQVVNSIVVSLKRAKTIYSEEVLRNKSKSNQDNNTKMEV